MTKIGLIFCVFSSILFTSCGGGKKYELTANDIKAKVFLVYSEGDVSTYDLLESAGANNFGEAINLEYEVTGKGNSDDKINVVIMDDRNNQVFSKTEEFDFSKPVTYKISNINIPDFCIYYTIKCTINDKLISNDILKLECGD